jgi:hypothetical protein
MLERSLIRYHQNPAPYFGTVLSDAVDIPALDATWHPTPDHQPHPAPDAPSPPARPTAPSADLAAPKPQPDRPPHPSASPEQPAANPEWSRIKLDEGPGWSREVLRHRSNLEAENTTSPSPLEGLGREERTKGRGEGSFSP